MIPIKLAFLDLETTGGSPGGDKIIEIGIVKVIDNKVVETFKRLVNPQTFVPPEIFRFTGINPIDLENASGFNSIADEVLEFVKDCTIVAHNARFDYGFLKKEFKANGISFRAKTLCTVRLSRKLYPDMTHHNLDALIAQFNIECVRRHRAFDDAYATWQFYKQALESTPSKLFTEAVLSVMKKVSIPTMLPKERLGSLPESAGVYIFFNSDGAPLYIGKSVNIKERVLSHFTNDYQSPTDMKLAQFVADIEYVSTAGDFSACLLESQLIKQRQPIYNKLLRSKAGLVGLRKVSNSDGYNSLETVHLEEVTTENLDELLAVYKNKQELDEDLATKIKEFNLCDKLIKKDWRKGPCFGTGIGRCKGACIGKENPTSYNLRVMEAFGNRLIKKWPFSGMVLIGERDGVREKTIVHMVDEWSYLGSYDQELGLEEMPVKPYKFDWDTYKILKRWLTNPSHLKSVRIVQKGIRENW